MTKLPTCSQGAGRPGGAAASELPIQETALVDLPPGVQQALRELVRLVRTGLTALFEAGPHEAVPVDLAIAALFQDLESLASFAEGIGSRAEASSPAQAVASRRAAEGIRALARELRAVLGGAP
jgi:hypothetical protein